MAPLAGAIKSVPEDFQVTETLAFEPDGDGEHDFLWIEKRQANTAWVASALARHAGVPGRDVGYCGLKDRHALTRQWFSVRLPGRAMDIWQDFALDGVRILKCQRHRRKLKRGAHRGNAFRIIVRCAEIDRDAVGERLTRILRDGVPNYFGAQRFGREAANLDLAFAMFDGRRLPREKRSIAISTARSFIFNEILHARIEEGTWTTARSGDVLALDGSNSVFTANEVDAKLRVRLETLDVHCTGAMWGNGLPVGSDKAAALELSIAARHQRLSSGLQDAGLKMERRSLRSKVGGLQWEFLDGAVALEFTLGRGAYATAVLRELVVGE